MTRNHFNLTILSTPDIGDCAEMSNILIKVVLRQSIDHVPKLGQITNSPVSHPFRKIMTGTVSDPDQKCRALFTEECAGLQSMPLISISSPFDDKRFVHIVT
jgi:hypothetical protein